MVDKRQIDISTGIIFRTILILLGVWLVYIIRDVVALFFIAVIFTAAIEPVVNWFQGKKIPRPFGVLIIYIILLLIVGGLISFLIPSITSQASEFSNDFPIYLEKLSSTSVLIENYIGSKGISFSGEALLKDLGTSLSHSSSQIFSTTKGVFSGFISLIVILSMTFYMSVIKDGMRKFFNSVTPEKHQEYVISLAERIKEKIGRWMIGQLFLMVLVFVLYYIVLSLLDVPYALILAIFGGLLEIIPYLGPIIAAVPAVFIGLLVSPLTGLFVLVSYTIVHQIESHVIVPQVMKKAIGLNPVAVILALLIGAKLAGPIGAILAVPVATAVGVFLGDMIKKTEESEVKTKEAM